ncbi:MAG: iron ABC transporter permease [Ectothiorhodospiraceae bacterium]|nr:iron ABC transporter permease [Ectothiorhodospiraceae bacterium]
MSATAASATATTGRWNRWPLPLRGWRWLAVVVAAVVLGPILVTVAAWGQIDTMIWSHLWSTVLGRLVTNTLLLIVGVGCSVLVIGVSLAWLTAVCEFPGRRFFDWALMLPLAVPAYVLAFTFIGIFDFSGPVQTLLRDLFGSSDWFPPVRSAGGVILVMSLVLYPYVYMLARTAFLAQGGGVMEAARLSGLGPWQSFFRVALPMARPAIAAGTALALMEALADFGAVAVFNYDTFTTAIYKVWFGFFSLETAAQLASLLLLFVALAVFGERYTRGRARFYQHGSPGSQPRIKLRGWRGIAAVAACVAVLGLAFVVPLIQLLWWVFAHSLADFNRQYLDLLMRTLGLGLMAAMITVTLALLLAYAKRVQPDWLTRRAVAASTLGYALPGSVLAVAVMLVFTRLDGWIAGMLGDPGNQWLTGTVWALLLAYGIRFMAVAFNSVDSALEQIRPSLADAARSLGAGPGRVIRQVYVPMLRPGLFAGALLVCVDVMKEMPATLLLRPYGWDTLAVRIFEFTSDGEWQRAAVPAVTLILVGLLPVMLLVRRSVVQRRRMAAPVPPAPEELHPAAPARP